MKKNYFTALAIILCGSLAFGQSSKTGVVNTATKTTRSYTVKSGNQNRAQGDTTFYYSVDALYLADSTEYLTFTLATEDADGLPTNNAGAPVDFAIYQSTNPSTNANAQPTNDNFYHPWEDPLVDTAFFLGATSWFNPPGLSNNWLMFGPVTIPVEAHLHWYDRTNPAYRDGYKVWVVSTIAGTEPSSIDFENGAPVGTEIFSRPDAYPSPTYVTDTTWVRRSAPIFGVNANTQVYFAFQHKANDMDVLYLDEFFITEGPLSVKENVISNVTLGQNQPNPFNTQTTIQYTLLTNTNVSFTVTDIAGRIVKSNENQNQGAGIHLINLDASDFAPGAYNYTLTANGASVTKKMFVTK